MASLFFFHFSKREKKASSLFIARLRFTAHASASKHTRVSLRWLSRARSFVRSIARAFASRSILARVFVRGLTRSLARSFVHSLARSRPARISHAFLFAVSLARSLAHTIPQIQKSTRWYTFVALRTKPAQNGCVRRLAGWANMPAFTPNHGRARKATHTHACGTDTSNFSSSHDRSPRMMLILSIKSLDSLADFFSSANLASFSAAIARSVYVFAVAKSPIANLDCAM